MIICQNCRRINIDDADVCIGCGQPLQNAQKQRKGSGITMFGSAPRQADITPLEKETGPGTISTSYGDKRDGKAVFEQDVAASGKPTGASFTLQKGQPKKPWE